MRRSSPSFSLPRAHEIETLTTTPPPTRYTRIDLEYYLRGLMQQYPDSQLLVFHSVTLIQTHCSTFDRAAVEGYVAVLRLTDGRVLLDLLGGSTGYESRYLSEAELQNPTALDCGWSACAGTQHRWHACYLPASCLRETYRLLRHALTDGPAISFPRLLTDVEQAARAELAKQRFIDSLRSRCSADHISAT